MLCNRVYHCHCEAYYMSHRNLLSTLEEKVASSKERHEQVQGIISTIHRNNRGADQTPDLNEIATKYSEKLAVGAILLSRSDCYTMHKATRNISFHLSTHAFSHVLFDRRNDNPGVQSQDDCNVHLA